MTWVCGDQRVLVQEVVDETRRVVAPADIDYVSVSHSATFERDVWAAANQYSLNPGSNRLILIRDAEKLTKLDRLEQWMARHRYLPGVYLLFVSNQSKLPSVPPVKAPRGYLVKCSLPAEPDLISWVRRRAPLDESTARHLLTRTGGDLDAAAGVAAKLSLFAGAAGTATVDALCAEHPAADFTDCLLSLDRKRALLCIPDLAEQDHGKLIALLDSRLDALHVLHRAQIAGQSYREITGINPYLVRQYMPIARHYDTQRCVYRRRVLAVVDDALRSGARTGVFEALVALW